MTPERSKAAENPNRWIYAFNIIVKMLELSADRFVKIEFDWRVSFSPDLTDATRHYVRMTLIARDPDIWQQPALVQSIGISRDEMDALNQPDNTARLFELIAARIEVGFRSLLQLLYEHNPDQRVRISEYA